MLAGGCVLAPRLVASATEAVTGSEVTALAGDCGMGTGAIGSTAARSVSESTGNVSAVAKPAVIHDTLRRLRGLCSAEAT